MLFKTSQNTSTFFSTLLALLFGTFIFIPLAYGLEQIAITPASLALIVNDEDPSSSFIADYYQTTYQIPQQNIIHVKLDPTKSKLSLPAFKQLKSELNASLLPQHRAVLFVWTAPFQVECQSITAAFTLGFDASLCHKTCRPSQTSPYYNQSSNLRLKKANMRLSMLLPSQEIELATKVIDKGIQSHQGVFKSTAYYLTTSDKARNSRAFLFPRNGLSFKQTGLSVVNKRANNLTNAHDIMIYQTGTAHVKNLPTLNFLPGALADHLTSYGGQLLGRSQMSVLAWLRAGATASYGTVSEPCNYWQKFPNPNVLLRWYASGNTAIEAYWKSVAWPSQGLFVGDPLAAPFAQ